MKHKTLLSLVVCSSALIAGCNTTGYNPFHSNAPMVVATQSNSNIVSDLVALNKNEIASARLALKTSMNPSVKKFAAMLNREHSKNLQQTLSISRKIHAPQDMSALSKNLQSQGQQEMSELSALSGPAFDKAYVNAMVRDHRAALNLLDQNLIPNSTNAMLTKHLQTTRQHVAMHLEHALALQSQLN